MKDIIKYIKESVSSKKFSKATINAIYKNITGATIDFDIKNWKFYDVKFYWASERTNKYLHCKYKGDYKWKDKTDKVSEDQMVFIYNNSIGIGKLKLKIDDYKSELVSTEYNEKENVTYIKYELSSLEYYYPYYLTGTVTLKIPSDVINAKEDYSDFDCKGYDKFMEKYLPKEEDYLKKFKVGEDVVSWSSMIDNNILKITVVLPTGKGYGDHHYHTKTYKFEWNSSHYDCTNNQLYDKDYEAQIVRKFRSGVSEFNKKTKMPEHVEIIIQQELD